MKQCRIIENGSPLSCLCITCFGRQYGVDGCTPRMVAVYKSASLPVYQTPTSLEWLAYYAAVGSLFDFWAAFWCHFWGLAPW